MSEPPSRSGAAGTVGGPGLYRAEGTTATLQFRRWLRHPIQDVWDALTDPDQVAAWYLTKVTREDAAGGRLEMEHPFGIRATGRVLAWEPPRTYEYEWNLPPGPDRPEGEASIVRWELSPSEGGTLLLLTHRRLTPATARVFVRGLGDFLDRLSAQLDGRPLPNPPWLKLGALGRRDPGPVSDRA